MKILPAQLAALTSNRSARRNLRALARYIALLSGMITVYSVLFHVLMEREGQSHSWLTGVYWTLTVMSTLGFGDITFHTDLGRTFSLVVLLSGVVFLLVMFPFAFIHFFYQPFLEAQERSRAPRELPLGEGGHVILTGSDSVVLATAERLRALGRAYVVLLPEPRQALDLAEDGFRVAVGSPDDVETWRRLRTEHASLVLAAADDYLNTNIAFTVRELSETVPIVSLARSPDSVDILQLAGSQHVVELAELLGRSLARRTYGGSSRAAPLGEIDGLQIAEAPATRSPLVGKTLSELELTSKTGVTVLGVWERGALQLPHADAPIHEHSVLVLAGAPEHLARFDALAQPSRPEVAPVVILGGGRVGRVVAKELAARGVDYRIVELVPERAERAADREKWVVGSAADLATLERAGIRECPTVVVTTRNDETNIYLTIYCRRLRPDVQIVARANFDRNVSTLHRAGSNFVMSYTSLGASTILALAAAPSVLHVAEGLDIFHHSLPPALAGTSLSRCQLRERTGCSVLAIHRGDERILAPCAKTGLASGDRLLLAGSPEARQALRRELG